MRTKIIIGIAIAILLSGCVTNEVRSFSDNKYKATQITNLAIMTNAPQAGVANATESSLLETLQKNNVTPIAMSTILPPTRAYTDDEVNEILNSNNLEMILLVNINPSQESATTYGYNSYSRGTYGYGNYSGNTNSYAMMAFNRNTMANSKVILASTGETIWTADIELKAGGKFFTSDSATGSHLAENIVNTLIKDGHIHK